MAQWRIPPSLSVAGSLLPSLEQQLANLQHQLIEATGKPLDLVYARLGLFNGYFFPQGWGDLSIVNLEQDIKMMQAWPPPGLKIDWKRIDQGRKDGMGYKLYEGRFKTPCINRIFDALPPESRTARVQFLVPDTSAHSSIASSTFKLSSSLNASGGSGLQGLVAAHGGRVLAGQGGRSQAPAAALHLAATGDQGFSRRLRLAFPMLQQGVSSMVHESPFYGARRPAAQKGSKLLRVSDLLALGWATIYESMNLLHWLSQEGYDEGGLCMAGLSMGGVHACMTAALYPHDVACAALLAPRSAAVAYCDGALSPAMACEPLLKEQDDANNSVVEVIKRTGRAVSVMGEATHALAELELAWEAAADTGSMGVRVTPPRPGHSMTPGEPGTEAESQQTRSLREARGAAATQVAAQVQRLQELSQWVQNGGLLNHAQSAISFVSSQRHRTLDTSHALPMQQQACTDQRASLLDLQPSSQAGHQDSVRHGATPSSDLHVSHLHMAEQQHVSSSSRGLNSNQQPTAQQSSQEGPRTSASAVNSVALTWSLDGPPTEQQEAVPQAQAKDWKPMLKSMLKGLSELKSLSTTDAPMERQKTLRRLKHVLETYTDITRFPVPRRPDASVFVAALNDAYVTTQSVQQLSDYWQGSELRLVTGGHVSAFLMHQDKFRDAIIDSIQRVKQRPSTQT